MIYRRINSASTLETIFTYIVLIHHHVWPLGNAVLVTVRGERGSSTSWVGIEAFSGWNVVRLAVRVGVGEVDQILDLGWLHRDSSVVELWEKV